MVRRLLLHLLPIVPVVMAACSSSPTSPTDTPPASANCSVTLGSTTLGMAGVGGTASIGVTTNSGCSWTVVSSGSFFSVTSGNSGTGPGTVTIAVPENVGEARSGSLIVAGHSVTVNQAAGDPVFGNWAGTIVKGPGCSPLLPASAQWSGTIRRNATGAHEFLINIPAALVFNQTLSLMLNGNALQMMVPVDTLYTFNATLASDRRSFSGTFSGGACSGTWSGTRQ